MSVGYASSAEVGDLSARGSPSLDQSLVTSGFVCLYWPICHFLSCLQSSGRVKRLLQRNWAKKLPKERVGKESRNWSSWRTLVSHKQFTVSKAILDPNVTEQTIVFVLSLFLIPPTSAILPYQNRKPSDHLLQEVPIWLEWKKSSWVWEGKVIRLRLLGVTKCASETSKSMAAVRGTRKCWEWGQKPWG